ncbi:MAG TPA: hypothetical protein VFQ54_04225 [Thermomicrobiales bacterium]|nr:hypothetical protein [Thermomicrobiales bacterium]
MNRRQLVKTAVFAGGVTLFSGFGPAPAHVGAQDKVKITQWYHQYGEEGTQDAVGRYAQQFSASDAGKGIEVSVVWQSGTYGDVLSAALLTDSGPDVFEQNVPTLDQVKQNQILALDDLYTPEVKADFNEVGLKAGTIDGKIYWVKMIDDTGAFYYKKSDFAAAGITAVPTKLSEVLDVASKLNSGRKKGLFLGNDGGVGAAAGLLMFSGGGDFFNADETKVAFNTDGVAAGYTQLKALNDSGHLLLGAPADYWQPDAFLNGLAAVQWTGMWALPAVVKALGDDVDIFPWPATDGTTGKQSTFWGGWGECVNGKTKYPDAAKALVKYLWIDSSDIQKDWALSYGFHVPPRKSAAASAEQLKTGPAAKFVANLNSLGRVTPPLWDAAMGTAQTQAVTNIISNGADAKSELDAAAKTAQAELDRLLKG